MNKSIVKSTVIKCIAAVICCAVVAGGGSSITEKVCSSRLSVAETSAVSSSSAGKSNGFTDNTAYNDASEDTAISGSDTTSDIGEEPFDFSYDIVDENVDSAQSTAVPTAQQKNENSAAASSGNKNTASSSAMSSVQEIVALYNKSVNRVKPEAKQLTRVYHHVKVPEESIELPSAIQGLGKTAIKQFVKNNDEPQSWTSREDIKTIFPVGGTEYSSKMTPDMVKSAICKDNGSTYSVRIVLHDDKITSPAKGQGYAGVFNTISASTFEDISIPTVTFEKVSIKGINGSIACTIDKKTQRVTEITFTNTDIMDLSVKVGLSNLHAKMNLTAEDFFKITY